MNGLKLTTYQLADLLFRRDGGGVLLSLCREAEAEYVTESGDPAMGREDRSGSSEQTIPEPFFLAENGNFAGVFAYEEDGDGYLLRSACLRDHPEEPLPFRSSASFGSSDRDSLHTARQFLVKAE